VADHSRVVPHPPGFRARRGLNWTFVGIVLGALLDRSWSWYFYFMAPFGLIGGTLMLSILGRVTLAKPKAA
jgi:hypothetical protein